MNIDVVHEPSAQRFVATVEGQECVVDYRLSGSAMTITHTGVPTNLGGRGIAGEMTRHVLDFARGQGWKVIPACSYAAAYIEKHPEYGDLLA